ncbi:hypothetical protein J5X84_23345 [Streptosporangiaceae bacterium NEAU-GS5]|nr:hypothetical protein [Streptosporangiaceae bacterium NEAU-GS5]
MSDELLVAAMRIAAGVDPVPAAVSADACAALGLQLPGSILAAPVPAEPGSGTRSLLSGTEFHRFAADGLTLTVEFELDAGLLRVSGQVTPPPGPGAWIEIRTPHLGKTRAPSDAGGYAVTSIPIGWLSVACHRPPDPPVVTRWILARP